MKPLIAAAILLLVLTGPAFGQQAPSSPVALVDVTPVHRLELAVGGLWLGGAALGRGEATVRANQGGGSQPPHVLFTETSRLRSASGVEARLGIALTHAWSVEGSFLYARPQVRTAISSDIENAAPVVATDRIDQYVIDAGVIRQLRRWTFGGGVVPFVSAGAGYLRQLHQGLFLIETGSIYRVGGGLTRWVTADGEGWIRATALRLDGRVYVPRGGFEYRSRTRIHPALSASAVVVF